MTTRAKISTEDDLHRFHNACQIKDIVHAWSVSQYRVIPEEHVQFTDEELYRIAYAEWPTERYRYPRPVAFLASQVTSYTLPQFGAFDPVSYDKEPLLELMHIKGFLHGLPVFHSDALRRYLEPKLGLWAVYGSEISRYRAHLYVLDKATPPDGTLGKKRARRVPPQDPLDLKPPRAYDMVVDPALKYVKNDDHDTNTLKVVATERLQGLPEDTLHMLHGLVQAQALNRALVEEGERTRPMWMRAIAPRWMR